MNEEDRDEFEGYVSELRSLYENNPEIVKSETREAVKRARKTSKNKWLSGVNLNIFGICALFLFILALGLVNINALPMYMFGAAFFIAGTCIGLFLDKFGLIFLASHGFTGMVIMIGSQIGNVLFSPVIEDLPLAAYIYLVVELVLFVIAFLGVVLYNLSDEIKGRRNSMIVPIAIFAFAFLMIVLFPRIFNLEVFNMFN